MRQPAPRVTLEENRRGTHRCHRQAPVTQAQPSRRGPRAATPESLDWVFVSPPLAFGAHVPAQATGSYRLGEEVAVSPDDGGTISAGDYALGLVDLVESSEHHRAQVNVAV